MNNKKEIRQNFRNAVFKRDKNACQACGAKYEIPEGFLDAHHITDRSEMPNGGYVKENGISLCQNPSIKVMDELHTCHMKAELFHISGGEEWWPNMHPDDLYKMINSSKELAIEKSNELEI